MNYLSVKKLYSDNTQSISTSSVMLSRALLSSTTCFFLLLPLKSLSSSTTSSARFWKTGASTGGFLLTLYNKVEMKHKIIGGSLKPEYMENLVVIADNLANYFRILLKSNPEKFGEEVRNFRSFER